MITVSEAGSEGWGKVSENCDRREGKRDQEPGGPLIRHTAERDRRGPHPVSTPPGPHTGQPLLRKSPRAMIREASLDLSAQPLPIPRPSGPVCFPVYSQALSPKPPLALSPGFWASIISSDGGSCDPKYRQGTGGL